MKKLILICIILMEIILDSCANVPPEAVQLSYELTTMIRSAQTSHIAMLNQYIQERKQRVNDFMNQVWIPRFMENFMADPLVKSDIASAVDSITKAKIYKEMLVDASEKINNQRDTLMRVVENIAIALHEAIAEHYGQMAAINQALTANISSAAKVTEVRERLLSSLNVDMKTLIPINRVNDILENALEYGKKGNDILNTIEEVKLILQEN